jgi:ligand-binding SRPBCC domain-containing protein
VKIFQLRARQQLDRPLDDLFDFFADAQNLGEVTPGWLRFRILSEEELTMRVGLKIDYTLRLWGIPVRWQSEITEWDPPHRFVDEQRKGPYRIWHHEHRFRADGDTTWVEDHVLYASIGGSIVNKLFLEPQLRQIFRFRQKVMHEKFGNVTSPTVELLGEARGVDLQHLELVS